MICKICKKDFSDSVYPFHVERCEKAKEVKAEKKKEESETKRTTKSKS